MFEFADQRLDEVLLLRVQVALGIPGDMPIAGNWDGWQTTNAHVLTVTANPDIYAITLDQTALSWPNYKFIINPFGTSTGGALVWENIPDRWFQVPGSDTNLPAVFFSNVSNITSVAYSAWSVTQ